MPCHKLAGSFERKKKYPALRIFFLIFFFFFPSPPSGLHSPLTVVVPVEPPLFGPNLFRVDPRVSHHLCKPALPFLSLFPFSPLNSLLSSPFFLSSNLQIKLTTQPPPKHLYPPSTTIAMAALRVSATRMASQMATKAARPAMRAPVQAASKRTLSE